MRWHSCSSYRPGIYADTVHAKRLHTDVRGVGQVLDVLYPGGEKTPSRNAQWADLAEQSEQIAFSLKAFVVLHMEHAHLLWKWQAPERGYCLLVGTPKETF